MGRGTSYFPGVRHGDGRKLPRIKACLLLRRFRRRTASSAGKGCMGVGGRPPRKGRENSRMTTARTVKSLKSSAKLVCSMLHTITFQSASRTLHQQPRTIIVTLESIEVLTALDTELARLGELSEGEKIRDAAAMDNPCRECAEIAQEYREAIIDFWTKASDQTRDACGVAGKLTGCTERDAANAAEKLRPFSSQELLRPAEKGQMRIATAISRKCFHQHRTGHHVNLRNR
jgi:hypothetical protein